MILNDKTCKGSCGKGEICSQIIHNNGYCWNPLAREKALDRKEADYYTKNPIQLGQKMGAEA